MATLKKVFKNDLGICPMCLYRISNYARLFGHSKWQLERRCHCRHIDELIAWPFEEEPTIEAVKPNELRGFGILFHNNQLDETFYEDDEINQEAEWTDSWLNRYWDEE